VNQREVFWRDKLAFLNRALHREPGSSVLEIMRREHPVGELRSRGEISETEFLSAMEYFDFRLQVFAARM
jgi:hypothetical protein